MALGKTNRKVGEEPRTYDIIRMKEVVNEQQSRQARSIVSRKWRRWHAPYCA
jgi:hypothetical protein